MKVDARQRLDAQDRDGSDEKERDPGIFEPKTHLKKFDHLIDLNQTDRKEFKDDFTYFDHDRLRDKLKN